MTVKQWVQLVIGAVCLVLGMVGVAYLGAKDALLGESELPARLWVVGAAALGLLTGLVTGLTKEAGSGKQFVAFIGTGLVVPLLGGVGALLARSQEVVERTRYAGTQIVQRSTLTSTIVSENSIHPLAVLGSFFVAFSFAAIIGVVAGALLRMSTAVEVTAA